MNPIRGIIKRIYWPICREYSRQVLEDKPADPIYTYLCSLYFRYVHGYWPDINHPKSFSEKLWNRMLFDRDPRWTELSDKLRARDYVESKIGGRFLVPLLWSGHDPERIPFDDLPHRFVIKANHGCKYNIIVQDKAVVDPKAVKSQLRGWLRQNYAQTSMIGAEWAYKNIPPMGMVEAFIEEDGNVPTDYKFFCYSGRAEFVQVSFDRFGDASEKILDRNLAPLELWNGLKTYPGKVNPPDNYDEMLEVAEALSKEIDFIRVDLYNVSGRIYVGELSCYPAAGIARFIPRDYDYFFGEPWRILRSS